MRIFKGLFTKSLLKKGLERQFQHIMTNKKTRHCRVFCVRCQLGLSAPNPDTRDFSRKVPWNLKSFAKIKWFGRWESSPLRLSLKERCVILFCHAFPFHKKAANASLCFPAKKAPDLFRLYFSPLQRHYTAFPYPPSKQV